MTKINQLRFGLLEEKKKVKYLKKVIKERDRALKRLCEDLEWCKEDHAKLYAESQETDYFIGEMRKFLNINANCNDCRTDEEEE